MDLLVLELLRQEVCESRSIIAVNCREEGIGSSVVGTDSTHGKFRSLGVKGRLRNTDKGSTGSESTCCSCICSRKKADFLLDLIDI